MIATVTPLSRKAKNRFANSMRSDSTVVIEQVKDRQVFFVSPHGYAAWATYPDPDEHWSINLAEPQ